jgi:hypothetical protein
MQGIQVITAVPVALAAQAMARLLSGVAAAVALLLLAVLPLNAQVATA